MTSTGRVSRILLALRMLSSRTMQSMWRRANKTLKEWAVVFGVNDAPLTSLPLSARLIPLSCLSEYYPSPNAAMVFAACEGMAGAAGPYEDWLYKDSDEEISNSGLDMTI